MVNLYDDEKFFDEYAKMTRSQKGLDGASEWSQFQQHFPDLKGKSVLDLGCGYGWHCEYAVKCGAETVIGIDQSEKMIQLAKEEHSHPRITYLVSELSEYHYPPNTFDFVLSNLVLHYLVDLESIFASVYKTLRVGGVFLFNMEHPIFTAGVNQEWVMGADGTPLYWPVDRYFYPGERTTNFLGHSVKKQHHTLTQILMGLLNVGFQLTVVEEAIPDASKMSISDYEAEIRRPMMLLLKAMKRE